MLMSGLIEENFTFQSKDQREIYVYRWRREQDEIKGIVQISHGMAETASRYRRFAESLTRAGYIVYANDHRGHGKSADHIDLQGYLGEKNGFKLLISDIAQLRDIIKEEHPGKLIYLFSHSMGSFAAQRYIMDYPVEIDGLILAGSNGEQGIILKAGEFIAKFESLVRGKKAKSKLMNKLTFGKYNQSFEPKPTGSEWLTRDTEELKKYLQNPYCGRIFPTSFYTEFLASLQYIEDKNNFHKIPQNLPIYILSGDRDPVGDFGKGVKRLKKRYENQGVEDIQLTLYKGARHELLNEINREEVTEDIIDWLDGHTRKRIEKNRKEKYAEKISRK